MREGEGERGDGEGGKPRCPLKKQAGMAAKGIWPQVAAGCKPKSLTDGRD